MRKGKTKVKIAAIKLAKPTYRIGISWDNLAGGNLDLDLQGVIVDDTGMIVDAVYHNNLSSMNGGISHSGDDEEGLQEGFDEFIQVRLSKLPGQCRMIIFVIAACNGKLKDADNGKVGLEEGAFNTIKEMKIERSAADCDVVAYFIRRSDAWWFQEVDTPAEHGSHFLDILEPNIGDIIRSEVPGAPKVQRVAFEMQKGALTDLPHSKELRRLSIGVGGALKPHARKAIDIDVAAILFSQTGRCGMVDGKMRSQVRGVMHTGDGVAGTRNGHDEAISIDVDQIDCTIRQVYIIMSIKDGTFEEVQSAYARVTDQSLNELASYDVTCSNHSSELIVASLIRQDNGRWAFTACGNFCGSPKDRDTMLSQLAKMPEETEATSPKEAPASKTVSKPQTKEERRSQRKTNLPVYVTRAGSLTPSAKTPESPKEKMRYQGSFASVASSRASITLLPGDMELPYQSSNRITEGPSRNFDDIAERFVDEDTEVATGQGRCRSCCRASENGSWWSCSAAACT